MDATMFITAIAAVILVVNLVSMSLWFWLKSIVRSVDDVVSDETAGRYATYLYGTMMAGRTDGAPRMVALGNPDRDPIVRAVRSSKEYEIVEWVASWVGALPINFVRHFFK